MKHVYIVIFEESCVSAGPFYTISDARIWVESLPQVRGGDGIIHRLDVQKVLAKLWDVPEVLAKQWAEWDKET